MQGSSAASNIKKQAPSGHPGINQTMGALEWGLIIVLSILWGGSFFFIKIAVREITPLTIVMYRVTIASLILVAFVIMTGRKMPSSPSLWGALLVMGAINNLIPFSLIVWSQQHIESSLAAILNATTPIFSVILASWLTREERLTANRISGIFIGWIGVAVLIGIESLKGVGVQVIGQIAVLGAALCYASAAIYGRRFKGMDPVVVSAGMLCGSAVMMIPLTSLVEQPWHMTPGLAALGALLGLAVISTSLAYIIYFRVLASAGATNILLVTFLIPISAILLGTALLGERLGWNVFCGMGLIFIGLIAIDGRFFSIFRR